VIDVEELSPHDLKLTVSQSTHYLLQLRTTIVTPGLEIE